MFSKILVVLLLLISFSSFAAGNAPEEVKGAETIGAMDVLDALRGAILVVDVRDADKFGTEKIESAENLIVGSTLTEESLSNLTDKDSSVVFYCDGENSTKSSEAAKLAVSWGFEKVKYYREGMKEWKEAGFPTE